MKSNGKFKIQKRNCISIYRALGNIEFDNAKQCLEYIQKNYEIKDCEIKYDKEW